MHLDVTKARDLLPPPSSPLPPPSGNPSKMRKQFLILLQGKTDPFLKRPSTFIFPGRLPILHFLPPSPPPPLSALIHFPTKVVLLQESPPVLYTLLQHVEKNTARRKGPNPS